MNVVHQWSILTVAMFFTAALVWQLMLAVADELRRTSRRCSTISLVLFSIMCVMTVHVCANKPQTNDTDGVAAPTYGLLSSYIPPEIGGLTGDGDAYSVTNIFFSFFGKTESVVSAGITIGEDSIGWGDIIRIYAADNLEHPVWTNAYERQLEDETSLAVQFDMSQFPTSFLHRAFFGLDYPQDSDGDSIDIQAVPTEVPIGFFRDLNLLFAPPWHL